MCMICVDLERDKLTFREGWRNFRELHATLEKEHKPVVKQKLIDKMVREKKEALEEQCS